MEFRLWVDRSASFMPPTEPPFYILSLDGGGSKGVYSLGALKEIESICGTPLSNKFHLIYGTSTGAIIAALLAQGKSVDEIKKTYFSLIPEVMRHKTSSNRSRALREKAIELFSEVSFSDFQTDIGIVSTHVDYARPMIFKSSIQQAHGMKDSFSPGFGATVSDAILASCAAYPFFEKITVNTSNQGTPVLMDGGFVANNPALFAIADALRAFKIPTDQIRVLSIGVGSYREPSKRLWHEVLFSFWPFWLARKSFDCNTNTIEILRRILFPDVCCVRLNKAFAERDYETDLLEADLLKLEKLYQLGRETYSSLEEDVKDLLGVL